MKLVTVDMALLQKFSNDPEMLHKSTRPCVLIIRLKYKEKNFNFAIPLRSNISANTPFNLYFALPPNSDTKPGRHHGIHYAKMFPVDLQYIHPFKTQSNTYATLLLSMIKKNEKQIVRDCQNYLLNYEQGIKPLFSTNIDYLLSLL